MKCKVKFSRLCKITTIAVILLFIGLIIFGEIKGDDVRFLYPIFFLMILSGLFYSPVSVEFSSRDFIIHRALKDKVIPLDAIKSADYCFPSGGGLRLCGSGGFMGFWGYFHDITIGSFFGYYGDREQCVVIRLKSGRQYVVSCSDPSFILNGIDSYLKK